MISEVMGPGLGRHPSSAGGQSGPRAVGMKALCAQRGTGLGPPTSAATWAPLWGDPLPCSAATLVHTSPVGCQVFILLPPFPFSALLPFLFLEKKKRKKPTIW